ncbi:MFS transporter, OCT family, solute carrier family 22 (organic cation transporter), member 4/5 [Paragonimus westermani]|uniref:MFS transporter, OCT family, solute carrier family 22 (Organic cation transporter), member 4/5 n=1 Tax=Paragonimus westermani TaxID=34504 RepID=A0A5J4NVL4_9TREM|nr:MFS transporter, OCT family, solute carrier family 22 (organic cation transporter), member 4/5 [Paragonimus westermani]
METRVEEFARNQSLSFEELARVIGPWFEETILSNDSERNEMFGCFRYALNWSTVNLEEIFLAAKLESSNLTEPCPYGYVFQSSPLHYPGNVVAEFETVCQRAWLVPTGTTIYMVGMLIGFILGGWSGYWYGRVKSLWIFCCVEVAGAIGVSLSKNYVSYVIFRALIAVGNAVKMSIGNVLVIELTVARYRSIFNMVLSMGLDFGHRSTVALFAYFLSDWRWLNVAMMSPSFLGLFYPLLLSESPRWLISRGRFRQAISQLLTGYRINHVVAMQPDGLENLHAFESTAEALEAEFKTMHALPKTRGMCRFCAAFKPFFSRQLITTAILGSVAMFGISMCLFGLFYYANNLKVSIYMLGFLNALTGIPSTVCSALIYRICSTRKRPLMSVVAMASGCLFASHLNFAVQTTPADLVLTVCVNVSTMLLTVCICLAYVYIPELFPAEVRTIGFGFVFGCSRLGAMLCPYVNELDRHVKHGFPLLVYAVTLVLVLLTMMGLEDTRGHELPNFVHSGRTVTATESECTQVVTYAVRVLPAPLDD